MNDVTFMILKLVVSVASALLMYFLIPILKKKLEDMNNQDLLTMIEVAVKAAEQTITEPGSGAAKKEEVLNFVRDWMSSKGIDITYEQLDQLIEAAVYNMNNDFVFYSPVSSE